LKNDEVVAQLSTDISGFLMDNWYIQSAEDVVWQTLTGPSVGDYMKTTAFQALIIWLILMVIYILLAFKETRKYISPAVLSGSVLCVMLFDIFATIWAYGVWMLLNDTLQVDTIFIIWVLTIIWYGINDVIVIFDRVRENMSRNKDKNVVYGRIFEDSIRQSVRRSISTSISTLIVLVAMFFLWNSDVLQQFSFIVWMWIIFSTLASIFLWAPLAYLLMWKYNKEKWKF
jgi:SecD/SecF fusion protein